MKKIIDAEPQQQLMDREYIPVAQFHKQLGMKKVRPYTSTFSFNPLIEAIQERNRESGKDDALGILPMLEQIQHQLKEVTSIDFLQQEPEKLRVITQLLFPSLFFEGQIGFVSSPFSKDFSYLTPAMEELFCSEKLEVKMPVAMMHAKSQNSVLDIGSLILKRFYDYDLDFVFSEVLTIRNQETKLEKHFKINIIEDYVKIHLVKPLKELSCEQIYQLINEWDNADLWMELLPPENFAIEGMVIGHFSDVTNVEILSELKQKIVEERISEDAGMHDKAKLTQLVCSFLGIPDLDFGILLSSELELEQPDLWGLIRGKGHDLAFTSEDLKKGWYGKIAANKAGLVVGDLQQLKKPGKMERHLIQLGIHSLLLAPLHDGNGKLIGIFELGAKSPFLFSELTLYKLREVISYFALGSIQALQELRNRVNLFVQQQYTSIHPSVEWKFREVAQRFLWKQGINGGEPMLDPIVFPKVYPLYGQADIVGSSQLRNQSIQADLSDNLQRAIAVMKAFREKIAIQLLDSFIAQAETTLKRLEAGEYISSDETRIVDLLTSKVHPLLKELAEQFDYLPQTLLSSYFADLDPKLGIIYRRRKAYEESVNQLNQHISRYLEQEDEKKQQVIPHYFEKYATDGVEYNIYLGEALMRDGHFSPFFLQDFRLWQLINMCEITRLVKRISGDLPVPLTTAQLIFVFNNSLNIRFLMDEKQFGVDGAYNVRYEILKKRIDKANVKGTTERLTQSGKIAIVWLQEKDRQEYLEYLHHLRDQEYITETIEELELEKLQGVEGLRALRVTVRDSNAI